MGYIPMHHNVIASQYGNRTQTAQPMIRPNPPVHPVRSKQIEHHKRREQPSIPSRLYVNRYQRHETKSKLTGKGHRFDALA